MPGECAIDTTVLQKANARILHPPRERSLFRKRIRLLDDLRRGKRTVLFSRQLLTEYEVKVKIPRNDYVRLFLEILADPRRGVYNWAKWPGRDREKARKCRYPVEDDHVLRTAIRPTASTIVTEERRMLGADECIYRAFRVHIIHTKDV